VLGSRQREPTCEGFPQKTAAKNEQDVACMLALALKGERMRQTPSALCGHNRQDCAPSLVDAHFFACWRNFFPSELLRLLCEPRFTHSYNDVVSAELGFPVWLRMGFSCSSVARWLRRWWWNAQQFELHWRKRRQRCAGTQGQPRLSSTGTVGASAHAVPHRARSAGGDGGGIPAVPPRWRQWGW
jgi:hypothetical protein